MKYVKKPVEIEAFIHDSTGIVAKSDEYVVPMWAMRAFQNRTMYYDDHDVLKIKTPEGLMTARDGDYIIRGVQGEIYPCKPDIFKMTYERVD